VRPPFAALLFLLTALGAAPGLHAEMCSGEYQSGARRVTTQEREQADAALRREREREAQAHAEQQAREVSARQAQAQRRAALPAGARLIEDRCTVCHGADTLAQQRHGGPGWWLIVVRMELFNGARLAPGERRLVVDYLATHQAAGPVRVAIEWSVLALVAAALVAAVSSGIFRRWRAVRA
jgi:cytochrome c5